MTAGIGASTFCPREQRLGAVLGDHHARKLHLRDHGGV
jgi:hypothetical protein